jgi:acyl carrier protein
MMDESINSRVLKVLKKITGRDFDSIDLNADLKSQLTLDSIQIVELIVNLEKEFDIELPLSIMTVRSASKFFTILQEQLAKKPPPV